ncbi:coiled-coil domain-containing protein, partial [Nonomuraea rhizosphaerae]|uniref:coiled-coil domain-containing protein n=1 Tax=Nonomuraea rhizosphaerae TaxID=2665663 RepID=UPI0035578E31
MYAIRTGFMITCLIATLCPPAHAAPGPGDVRKARHVVRERSKELGRASAKLAKAQARLDDLAAGAERAVEAYNGERVHLERAGHTLERARARLTVADAEVEKARAPVALLAARSYSGLDGIKPTFGMLTDSGDKDGFLHRASTLAALDVEG